MIKNKTQYKITKKWAKAFKKAAEGATGDDAISHAQRKCFESMYEDLKQQVEEYRSKHLEP